MTMVTFRTDSGTEALLAELARPGESRSDTIRRAIQDAARLKRREQMRAEAETCRDDPADRAEASDVLADMDGLRAW